MSRVIEARILQPGDVEADLVPSQQFLVCEGTKPFGFLPRLAWLTRPVAGDKRLPSPVMAS